MMAKLIQNVRDAVAGVVPLTADEIERRIATQETTVAQLVTEHQRAALAAEAGVQGADADLADVSRRLQEARDRIVTLRGAHVAAHEQDAIIRRKRQSKLQRDNLARIAANLARRDAAAERLQLGISTAVAAYREMVEASEKANLPVPGVEFPNDGLLSLGLLRQQTERELFRQGAVSVLHDQDFPGGKAYDFFFYDQPEKLPALTETIKAASKQVLSKLQAQVGEAA